MLIEQHFGTLKIILIREIRLASKASTGWPSSQNIFVLATAIHMRENIHIFM